MRLGSFPVKMSDRGDWGDSADDDGSELIRTLSRLVPFSDVDVSSESEESSDEGLVTVSEKSYHSDGKAASTYLAAAKKNLPEEERVEEVSFRPSYLSNFEKEHFHRENVMPDRPYTAFFTAPSTAFATKDIFDALLSDGIPASAVRCLQRSPNGNVLITFASKRYRDLFLRRSCFVVRRGSYITHPGSRSILFVTIYDAPHELPDSAIEYRLRKYGRIFSSRRGKVPGYPDVFNGLRHLRMELDSHIPCFLRFGKFQIRVKYDGQPTTCRRCNSRDHLFKDCRNEVCFNCDRAGHHSRLCPEDMRCCICKEEGHLAIDCQHSWYRRPPASNTLSPEPSSVVTPPAPESAPDEPTPETAAAEPLLDQVPPEDEAPSSQMLVEESVSNEAAQSSPPLEESSGTAGDRAISDSPGDAGSQQPSSDVRVLDSQGNLIPEESAVAEKPADVSSLPEPSLPDSVLVTAVLEDPSSSAPASEDPVFSVSDSVLAQVDVPSPSDAPALDLAQPDENSDDDEMEDSATPLDDQQLATAWKRVSRKKGQRRKNLARKATTSHSFAPVRKATRPNPPGARPNRGKDPPE